MSFEISILDYRAGPQPDKDYALNKRDRAPGIAKFLRKVEIPRRFRAY